jgi:peptidoglycan/LPS O-acetylase OafA/YrhL
MTANFYKKFRRITTNQVYLPEIDGIRFLAISLVILYHIYTYFISHTTGDITDSSNGYPLLNSFMVNGLRGVELFFVLSGFILCLPFAHHYINEGKKVTLKNYYIRRLTRLEPPYFIAITGIFLTQIIFSIHPFSSLLPSWMASLIYSHMIIFRSYPLVTVVSWSLEIEIQFYLLAPLLFRVLALGKSTRRAILVSSIVGIICLQRFYHAPVVSLYGYIQYFLTGILLADLYVSNSFAALFGSKWMSSFAVICFVTIVFWPIKDSAAPAAAVFLARLSFPFLVAMFFYIILKNEQVKQVASYKFIPVIGGMCYSIYLLHYTVISIAGRISMGFHVSGGYLPNLLLQISLFIIMIVLVSSVFFYFIERPFMSIKWLHLLTRKKAKYEEINMVG